MGVSGDWPICLIKMYHAHTSFVLIQTRGCRLSSVPRTSMTELTRTMAAAAAAMVSASNPRRRGVAR